MNYWQMKCMKKSQHIFCPSSNSILRDCSESALYKHGCYLNCKYNFLLLKHQIPAKSGPITRELVSFLCRIAGTVIEFWGNSNEVMLSEVCHWLMKLTARHTAGFNSFALRLLCLDYIIGTHSCNTFVTVYR